MSSDLGFVTEPAREVPIRWEADVVVCGGGPAGTAAAIAAARQGAKVILLERYGCLGGLATGGLVIALPSFEDEGRPIVRGLGYEIRQRLIDSNEAQFRWTNGGCIFDPEALKWLSVRMCREAGVKIIHHVWIANALVKEGRLHAAIVESKSGRLAVRGKVFVDATGDGDLFAAAGCAFEISNQWLGLPFRVGNVDLERWETARLADPAGISAAMEAARTKAGWGPYAGFTALPWPDGCLWCNNMLAELNGLDPEELTYVETEGREVIRRYLQELRQTVPGFERAWLLDTASQVGVRRTRRLVGEYVMTGQDVSQYDFRIQDAIGRGNDFRRSGVAYDIAYRSLLPREVGGLLVAGRCLSCTDEALEPLREIHICWVMGEAAGLAAAMCVQQACEPRELCVSELQAKLRAANVAFAD